MLLVRHLVTRSDALVPSSLLFLRSLLVTSKALVTRSDALVPSSLLFLRSLLVTSKALSY